MLICCRCKHVFDEEYADKRQEYVGEFWGSPAYDETLICPECGCDELDEFEKPEEWCDDNPDCDYDCENCKLLQEQRKDEDMYDE